MPPEHLDLQNVTFFVGGQKIGTGVQTLVADIETAPVDSPFSIGKYEGSITIEEPFYFNPAALLGPMDVTISKLVPYKKPRSKKKRIQKKYAKKYTISKETIHDCTIVNIGEVK